MTPHTYLAGGRSVLDCGRCGGVRVRLDLGLGGALHRRCSVRDVVGRQRFRYRLQRSSHRGRHRAAVGAHYGWHCCNLDVRQFDAVIN